MSSPDKQSSYMEPSSPIGRTQSGLAALFVLPSPKKTDGKADQAANDEPYIDERKPSSTTAAKDNSNNGPSPKKTDGIRDQVVDYTPFVNERKPSSMTAVKINLHNGEHTLIPVMVKMIHSAVQDCKDAPLSYLPCSISDGSYHHPPKTVMSKNRPRQPRLQ